MRFLISTFAATFLLAMQFPAVAAELPASQCQIYVKKIRGEYSSHSASYINATVKVNWLGNGETIEKVGFRGHRLAQDLGNDPQRCSISEYPRDSDWLDYEPSHSGWADSQTLLGESLFNFQIYTGSISSICPGTKFTTVGVFFVKTNKNTYWVNPDFDSSKNFVFDENAHHNLTQWNSSGATAPYYNPANCQ